LPKKKKKRKRRRRRSKEEIRKTFTWECILVNSAVLVKTERNPNNLLKTKKLIRGRALTAIR